MVPLLAKVRNVGIEVAPASSATCSRGLGPATPRKARQLESYIVVGFLLLQVTVLFILEQANEKTRRELRRVSHLGEGRGEGP